MTDIFEPAWTLSRLRARTTTERRRHAQGEPHSFNLYPYRAASGLRETSGAICRLRPTRGLDGLLRCRQEAAA